MGGALCRENNVQQAVLDAIDRLPQMPELDEPPTIEELSKAIDKLPSGKAAGKDGIPAEILKSGKSSLLVSLHKLLTQCWKKGSVPEDMKDANIITLFKNKGDNTTATTIVVSLYLALLASCSPALSCIGW